MVDFATVDAAISKKMQEEPEFRAQVASSITTELAKQGYDISKDQLETALVAPDTSAPLAENRGALAGASAEETLRVEARWWCWFIVVPHSIMEKIANGGMLLGALTSALGAAVVVAGVAAVITGPIVAVAAGLILAQFALYRVVDQGKGVYLTAVWVAPTVFVPTPI
jgi:hypothetical protein